MSKSSDSSRTARAQAIRAQQDRAERNKKMALVVGVLAALAVIVAVLVWQTMNSTKPATLTDVPTASGDHSLLMGKDSAPMKVVVYEDFLCPFCREFEESSRDFLVKAAQQGKVQVEYRPFHLLSDDQNYSLNTLNAFAAILANDPQKALAFHDLAFDNQPYETAPNKPTVNDLKGWAKDVGVGSDVLAAFDTVDQTWVDAATQAAVDAKVKGTPTVLVDGKKLDGATIADMAKTLESQIAALK